MNILVISNYRAFHSVRPEAEIFIALQSRGHQVTIMTYGDSSFIPLFRQAGIAIIPHHPSKKYDPEFIKILRDTIYDGDFDILQVYNNKALRNALLAIRNVNDIRLVSYRGASANMAWYNPINYFKFFHPRIDATICNSVEIQQKYKSAIGEKRYAVTIHKGHKVDWYKNVKPIDLRTTYGIHKDTPIFITVANDRKVKGISVLLEAISILSSDVDAAFVIVGHGMEKYSHRIKKLFHKTLTIGYKEDATVYIAGADAYICPSTGSEALTKSVIEALAHSIPPIISDIEGNKPLVDEGKNGLIFKNRNAQELAYGIRKLAMDKDLRAFLSSHAPMKIEKELHIDHTVDKYEDLYRSLL